MDKRMQKDCLVDRVREPKVCKRRFNIATDVDLLFEQNMEAILYRLL